MNRHPHALNASVILLGISFFMVAMLRYTHLSDQTLGDETAWFAGLFFLGSTALAFLATRKDVVGSWHEVWLDRVFMAGLAILALSTLLIGFDFH